MKRVQNIFNVENVFHLQLIEVVDGTQMNLKWVNLEEKRNEEEFCEVCGVQEMRKIVVSLVNNLLGLASTRLTVFLPRILELSGPNSATEFSSISSREKRLVSIFPQLF